jgi:replicative DNA helicase
MTKLAYEIASHEKDNNALVIYHTIDDTAEQLIPRIVTIAEGSRYLTMNMVKDPNYWAKQEGPQVDQKRRVGYDLVESLVKHGRLVVKDANHGSTLAYMETLINYYQEKYPSRRLVYFLDNFHKLTDYQSADNERVRFKTLSKAIKSMATRYHIPILCTMEYTKLPPGTRPSNNNLAESVSMEYDSNFIAHMYNELHELGPQANSYHVTIKDGMAQRFPRIEMIIGKNKISSFKNSLYYDFYPASSDFIAIDEGVIAEEIKAAKEEKEQGLRKSGKASPGGMYQ